MLSFWVGGPECSPFGRGASVFGSGRVRPSAKWSTDSASRLPGSAFRARAARSDASFLGVLLAGDLAASVLGDGGQREVIGRLKAGDTFGEMALMSGDKTMADFIAD